MEIEYADGHTNIVTLADTTIGRDVFRFPNEDDDSEWEPHVRVDTVELGVRRCKPGTKGKSKREFSVKEWLDKNDFVAVVSLLTGVITVHTEETIVIPMTARVVVE